VIDSKASGFLKGQNSALKAWLPDWRPLVILAVGFLFRLLYHISFKPWWCGDSGHYSLSTVLWTHGYFTDGSRTPIYPLFLGFAQWLARVPVAEDLSVSAAELVRDIQCGLGLLAACLIYDALRAVRVKQAVAFGAGLFFATTALVCNVEMGIVTPSLSAFSLVLGIWLYARMMARVGDGESARKLAVLLGFAIAFAVLLRPDNLVFFVAIVLSTGAFAIRSLFLPSRANLARRLLVVCFLVPLSAAPLILAWMTCNYIGTGRFRITNMMGWQMTQSVYNMYDRVDPEDRVLGGIMTKYYAATNRNGINREYIWLAMGEVKNRAWEMPYLDAADNNRSKLGAWVYSLASDESRRFSNQGSVALGDYLKRVAWKLIRKNPSAYLHNAADSFLRDSFDFTASHSGTSPEEVEDPRAVEGGTVVKSRAGWKVIHAVAAAQAPFLTAFYVLTLAYVLFSPFVLLRNSSGITTSDVAVTALAMGTEGTFAAFCLLESYHNQYGVPHISVLVVCTGYAVGNFRRIRRAMFG